MVPVAGRAAVAAGAQRLDDRVAVQRALSRVRRAAVRRDGRAAPGPSCVATLLVDRPVRHRRPQQVGPVRQPATGVRASVAQGRRLGYVPRVTRRSEPRWVGNPKHTEVSVARQSPQRPDADEPELDDADGPAEPGPGDRPPSASVDRGSGTTSHRPGGDRPARRHRLHPAGVPAGQRADPDRRDRRDQDDPFLARRPLVEEEEDDETVVILDEELAEELPPRTRTRSTRRRREAPPPTPSYDESDEAVADEADDEEVPIFLSHRGKLLLFKTPESLVSFIRSGAPNDLSQLDSWNEFRTGGAGRFAPLDGTPTSSTSWWRTCAAGTTRGIRPC